MWMGQGKRTPNSLLPSFLTLNHAFVEGPCQASSRGHDAILILILIVLLLLSSPSLSKYSCISRSWLALERHYVLQLVYGSRSLIRGYSAAMDTLQPDQSPNDHEPPVVDATDQKCEVHVAEIPKSSQGSPEIMSTPRNDSDVEGQEPKNPMGATAYPLANNETAPDIPVVSS